MQNLLTPIFCCKYLIDIWSPENCNTSNEGDFSSRGYESHILCWNTVGLGALSACYLLCAITRALMWIIHIYIGLWTLISNSSFQNIWSFWLFVFYTEQNRDINWKSTSKRVGPITESVDSCKDGRCSSSDPSDLFININSSFTVVQLWWWAEPETTWGEQIAS